MNQSSSIQPPAFAPAVPPTRGTAVSAVFIVAAVLTLALAAVWSYVTHDNLRRAIAAENYAQLERVSTTFEVMRTRTQDSLRAQCRVLAEDPRLKATLATEGMDEATVADILDDLRKLQHSGFLMVLTPEGRVFAESGADELRGLDLSGSTVFQKARSASEATVASWVIGKKVMDLGAMPIRSDSLHVAYLVVGQALDAEMITALALSTGVPTALGVGAEILVFSSAEPNVRAVLSSVTHDPRRAEVRVIEAGGDAYVAAFIELDQTQNRPYLVVARNVGTSLKRFELVDRLLWLPAGLVLIALMIARVRSKQLPRMPRNGGV